MSSSVSQLWFHYNTKPYMVLGEQPCTHVPHTNIRNIFLKSKAIHHKNYKLYLFYDQRTFKAQVFFQGKDMSINSQHSSDKQKPNLQTSK